MLILRVIDSLESFSCVEDHLFMDEVLDHEAIVLDLLLFEASLVEVLL